MKKINLLMALLTLFGASSPANAVESTTSHEDLAARVLMHWNIDHETRTITNNEELCEGRNFTEDQLTTIFNDLEAYLTTSAMNDYAIHLANNFLIDYPAIFNEFSPITKFNHTIGNGFLQNAESLTTFDTTELVNLREIGTNFLPIQVQAGTSSSIIRNG